MDDFSMVKEQADLNEFARKHLTIRGNKFNCPICGSGTGKNETPAFSVKGKIWTCFACKEHGDIFDLTGILYGTDSKREQMQIVANWAGIHLDSPRDSTIGTMPKKPEPVKDYTKGREAEAEKIKRWQANIEAPEAVSYLQGRGITIELAKFYGLGYDPTRKRVIIPYPGTDYYHIDRDITGTARNKYSKPKTDEVGPEPIYGGSAIESPVIFIVEGPFDAMSVEACGHRAIALGSTAYENTARHIIANSYSGCVIVALDNDEQDKGPKHQREMVDRLTQAGIWAVGAEYPEGWPKDFSEAYEKDSSGLAEFLWNIEQNAINMRASKDEEEHKKALNDMRVFNPADLAMSVYLLEQTQAPIPTGFSAFDSILGDGLQPGLYILGAVSSMGKTTLAVQIADHIAESGQPVLFVTIEQRAREITAKSLSRIARGIYYSGCDSDPITAQEITNRKRRGEWSEGKTVALYQAAESYTNSVSPKLRIMEGVGQPSVSDIKAAAAEIMRHEGKAPVIFIDYLQLLKAQNDRDTDKQTTDKNVMDLKQLAGDMKTPIFAISSLNRANYNGAIGLEAFKESGAIEYGSDVLMGLQPAGIAEKNQQEAAEYIDTLKTKPIREVELSILKNRNGVITGRRGGIRFTYDAPRNNFTELPKQR